MKTDLIICHPKDTYYPIWVYQLNKYREMFNKVIIATTQKDNDFDFTEDLKKSVDAEIIDPCLLGKNSWYTLALNAMIDKTEADNILFMEQDFIAGNNFFKNIFGLARDFDAVGYIQKPEENYRYHPSCLLVKKALLEKTSRNFDANPFGDCFCLFSHELWLNGKCIDFNGLKLSFFHMNGVTQNYRLQENFYKPNLFYLYNLYSLDYSQPEKWKAFCEEKEALILKDLLNLSSNRTYNLSIPKSESYPLLFNLLQNL